LSPPSEPARLGLRERKKLKTRLTIQTEALRLFRTQGYDATTVEEICDAAEVSPSTFFRYFPSKAEVVLWDEYDPLIIQAFRDQPARLTPPQALRNAFRTVIGRLSADQRAEQLLRMSLILAEPELRAAMLSELTRTMRLLGDLLAERAGRNPEEFAVRVVAGAIMGAMVAVMAEIADNPKADLADVVDRALAQLDSGVTL
jgi:AcrR family transcriptional regulator